MAFLILLVHSQHNLEISLKTDTKHTALILTQNRNNFLCDPLLMLNYQA